jgi:hypothetical protein
MKKPLTAAMLSLRNLAIRQDYGARVAAGAFKL